MTAMMVHREKSFTEDFWKKEAMKLKKQLKKLAEISRESIISGDEKIAELEAEIEFAKAKRKEDLLIISDCREKINELEAEKKTYGTAHCPIYIENGCVVVDRLNKTITETLGSDHKTCIDKFDERVEEEVKQRMKKFLTAEKGIDLEKGKK